VFLASPPDKEDSLIIPIVQMLFRVTIRKNNQLSEHQMPTRNNPELGIMAQIVKAWCSMCTAIDPVEVIAQPIENAGLSHKGIIEY